MRRFSQRNALVTLSDINITPLLDLAFVLLIIFVIISPSIRSAHEQSVQLHLPKGGQPERKINPKDVMTVEVTKPGGYHLNGRPVSLAQLRTDILRAAASNPKLIVWLREDRSGAYEKALDIVEICQDHGIDISFATEPRP